MKILLLHLSDFHFRRDTDPLVGRVNQISSALGSVDALPDACVVAATGDIAFSGNKAEYDVAAEFFRSLRIQLAERYGEQNVTFFLVPGNHDCDFSKDPELRSLVLENLPSKVGHLAADDISLRTLLTAESDFFLFASKWMSLNAEKPWVFYSETVSLNKVSVRARGYNTAYASQLDEQQGELLFPLHLAPLESPCNRADLITIALLHHPFPWFESNNGLAFRKHIDTVADIVLTGHQHIEATYTKRNMAGDEVNYFEGAALQGTNDADSGFNVVLCDLQQQQLRKFEFRWNGESYTPTQSDDWSPFVRHRRILEPSPEYQSHLNDPGTGFTHPRKARLTLEDIFVFPDINKLSLEKRIEGRATPELIPSKDVKGFLLREKKLIVSGGDRSGKTSLAKTLYVELLKLRLIPVTVLGDNLKSVKEKNVIELVNDTFKRQYTRESLENYKQLEISRKVLIIDDWHRTRLTWEGKAILLDVLTRLFGRIYLFSGEGFRIEEISKYGATANPLRAFNFCELREFGHVLRAKLIERWYSIGRDFTWDINEHAHEFHETEKLLSTLLGKNLIPSYPETVLSILQAFETHRSPSTPSGSYGYLYEALLTSALANVCKDSSELDLMYTVISKLAFYLFQTDRKLISQADVEEISRSYFSEYSIDFNRSDLLERLEIAQVLVKIDGNHSFRYRYVYYYFVARYFQEALRDSSVAPDMKKKLYTMADQVYYEEYSRILMFVLYLTKDSELIRHIIENANSIYRNQEPCDFQQHIDFINRLYKEAPKVLISSSDLEKNREEYRKKLDEERSEDKFLQVQDEKLAYSEELNDIIKINIACKTLDLLGQTLKNFPGSLHKGLKLEMAHACYFLGLRLARAILRIAENNLEQFRNYIAELIREHRSSLTESELAKTTDEAVIWLTRRVSFAILKRVSYAVGLELLRETYKDLLEASKGLVSVRLIDLSVKLDHFTAFPEGEVQELWDQLAKNYFCETIIRDMVAHYIYLFGLDYRILQRIGAKLDIEVSDPRFRDPRTKKLK